MEKTESQGISAHEPSPEPKGRRSVKECGNAAQFTSTTNPAHGNRLLDEAAVPEDAALPVVAPEPIVSINGLDVDAREIDKAA